MIVPVAPSRPDGTSTAITGAPAAAAPATASATPSSGLASPAPNMASTTSAAPCRARSPGRLDRPSPRAAARRRHPSAPRGHQRRNPDGPTGAMQLPRHHPAVAAIVAGAAQDECRPRSEARMTARGTARPAFSISHGPGKPRAIAARSTAAMAPAAGAPRRRAPSVAAQAVRYRAWTARSIAAAVSRSRWSRWTESPASSPRHPPGVHRRQPRRRRACRRSRAAAPTRPP